PPLLRPRSCEGLPDCPSCNLSLLLPVPPVTVAGNPKRYIKRHSLHPRHTHGPRTMTAVRERRSNHGKLAWYYTSCCARPRAPSPQPKAARPRIRPRATAVEGLGTPIQEAQGVARARRRLDAGLHGGRRLF